MVSSDDILDILTLSIQPESLTQAQKAWLGFSEAVLPTSPLYEERSDAFLEWYATEWRNPEGVVPFQVLLESAQSVLTLKQKELGFSLLHSYRSVFRVEKLLSGAILLFDLWGHGRFLVSERRRCVGLSMGDWFEARLFLEQNPSNAFVFSNTFLLHPREAYPVLWSSLQREKSLSSADRTILLGKLQRCRFKVEEYKHLPPPRIYSNMLK